MSISGSGTHWSTRRRAMWRLASRRSTSTVPPRLPLTRLLRAPRTAIRVPAPPLTLTRAPLTSLRPRIRPPRVATAQRAPLTTAPRRASRTRPPRPPPLISIPLRNHPRRSPTTRCPPRQHLPRATRRILLPHTAKKVSRGAPQSARSPRRP